MKGQCSIPNCTKHTEQIIYALHEPPIYCGDHLHDGTDTHLGQYLPTSVYYNHWTCCGSSWKMSKCSKHSSLFDKYSKFIPVDDFRTNTAEKQRDAAEREAERLAQENLNYSMGIEPAYDRS